MKDLVSLFRFTLAGLRVLIVVTVVCGVAYPLAVTAAAQVAMPWRANGSLVTATGAHTTNPHNAVGSAVIGQPTTDPGLFYPRPSAAGSGYDMTATAGTNLGPNDPRLVAAIAKAKATIAKREGVSISQVPPDAATSSASGLDPDISPAYAAIQIPRVAKANGLTIPQVTELVATYTSGRTWGVLGEPHVNVLLLNIAVRDAATHR
ncbi:potassium-transporting ATPase KdpC subunit [Nocardioides baekrokdamisoli]|uniref:Potassium-transporting ATPase KdpC subunit n=1 Tax=Nocardioides baekrokdamisoli TaxID=1804624 RepID=A0A3G9IDW7_9ACTN|nr:potassium-transporting ATPase subunit KdpC [Nocardioides baekrokdamisoli]BBH16562.1 potassium-transporting ATPase KdpC subunit [Nocardioides baekrokdamisoli]